MNLVVHNYRKVSTQNQNNSLIFFQLVLDEDEEGDRKMADKLIAIYFSFFKASIKKGDIDSKLVRIKMKSTNLFQVLNLTFIKKVD